MKHVVFLTENYYPNYSAVSNCAEKIINLLKKDFKISIIAVKDDCELTFFEKFNGCDIYRIERKYQEKLNKLNLEMRTFPTFFTKYKLYVARAFNLLKFVFQKESIDSDLVNSYFSELKCLNKKNNIDAIIPVCLPMEAVLASLLFKKTRVHTIVIPYVFDHFSKSNSLHRLNANKRLKFHNNLELEKYLICNSDAVFSMHPLINHYHSFVDAKYRSKIIFVEHPLLLHAKNNLEDTIQNEVDGINVTYTGSFIKNHVEPNYLLDLFVEIDKSLIVKLNLFTVGHFNGVISDYANKYPSKISSYGAVSKNDANTAVIKAHVLVNVGEVTGKQISSKIFEYMSVGKPIIHIAFIKGDIVSQILSKYPLVLILIVTENNFKKNLKELYNFLIETKNKTVSFQDVSDIYPEALPEVTANLFKEKINDLCKETVLERSL